MGMSGAGKSGVLQNLRIFGYFCVDNLPPVLIPKFAELCRAAAPRSRYWSSIFAAGSWCRTEALAELAAGDYAFDIAFLGSVRRCADPAVQGDAPCASLGAARTDFAGDSPRAGDSRRYQGVGAARHRHERLDAARCGVGARFASVQKGEEFVVSVVSFGFKHGCRRIWILCGMCVSCRIRTTSRSIGIVRGAGRGGQAEYIGKWDRRRSS